MKAREFLELPLLALKRPDLLRPLDRDLLFVLGHMRGYTSLISLILGNHPEICGHLECHIKYQQIFSRFRLQYSVSNQDGGLDGRYILDKCLHNGTRFPKRFTERNRCHFLFTVRQPAESLISIYKLRRRKLWAEPMEAAASYYCGRMGRLVELSRQFPGSYYFCGESIIDDSEALLASLTRVLQLGTPLSSQYTFFEDTGRPGAGDYTENIRAGKILSSQSASTEEEISIPPRLLADAEDAYTRCLEAFMENLVPVLK
jgi:hypothetical protein